MKGKKKGNNHDILNQGGGEIGGFMLPVGAQTKKTGANVVGETESIRQRGGFSERVCSHKARETIILPHRGGGSTP